MACARKGFSIFCVFLAASAFPAGAAFPQVDLEPIRVWKAPKHTDAGVQAPAGGIFRALDSFPAVDLRSRGPFGIQQDLSLRGATFEQSRVSVDGIPLNDPQTGHYSLDLPLTRFDVAGLSIGDSADFSLKRPDTREGEAEFYYGEHALFGQAGSVTLPSRHANVRISFEHASAKAARPDTDFREGTASFAASRTAGRHILDAFFGTQEKDYGASTFYSNLFPQEEEHTRTRLAKAGVTSRFGKVTLANTLFWRRHWDKFILQRHVTAKSNVHTSDTFGFDSHAVVPLSYAEVECGARAQEENISSTSLGNHSRSLQAARVRVRSQSGSWINAEAGIEPAYLTQWHWEYNYDAGLRLEAVPGRLRIEPRYEGRYRIPSFTELYYHDAANIGDPSLGVEHTGTWSLKGSYLSAPAKYSLAPFWRRGKDLIDWTRTTPSQPWIATNLGKVDVLGAEAGVEVKPDWRWRVASLEKASFSYIYMEPRAASTGMISKYALDIVKHKASLGIDHSLLGGEFSWRLSYVQRHYGETYFLADLTVSRRFLSPSCTVTPFISADNLFDARYSEVGGVLQPGRWVRCGMRVSW